MSHRMSIGVLVALAGSVLSSSAALAGSCSDPWVTAAVTKYLHRAPSGPGAPECNAQLYRGGHWKNQQDLDAAVDAYWATHPYPKTATAPAPAPTQPHLNLAPQAADFQVPASALGYPRGKAPSLGQHVTYNGKQYQVTRVVSQGGGNVVSQGGGNVVSQGGGNVVSQGGGNFSVTLKLLTSDGAGVQRR